MNAEYVNFTPATISDPAVWNASTLKSKDEVLLTFSDADLHCIEALLKQSAHKSIHDLTWEDFDEPSIHELLSNLHQTLQQGPGVAVLHGIDVERFSERDLERLFWGLSSYMGRPVVQSTQGDRIGHVRHEVSNPKNRGYQSNRELGFHSDAFEIIGLMCLSSAASGGTSQIVSGLAVHNQLLEENPALLPVLYEGYPYATAERAQSGHPVTDYRIPVFSQVNGRFSSMCVGNYMRAAALVLKQAFPEEMDKALKAFYQICNRKEFQLEFMLEPGEMLFLNNFTTLHSRTEFQDSETQKRHLLRLWLDVHQGRPVIPQLKARGADYEQLYLETHQDARVRGAVTVTEA
ncbi:TauD/TfdA family dioxygenase [Pseudomonas fluorescens]|uniref:TauD/TfdA family dioxygenase n=1 Tax=Pseudomonas fluorescens TaxID=294 RepID=UPI00112FFF4F|nr:TauD/TfdA family dioxygenase [Pseudomonas fluorescens]TMU81186.1 TauD/TfdA family dioxygenase [Pseudomonas fluorescens]